MLLKKLKQDNSPALPKKRLLSPGEIAKQN